MTTMICIAKNQETEKLVKNIYITDQKNAKKSINRILKT